MLSGLPRHTVFRLLMATHTQLTVPTGLHYLSSLTPSGFLPLCDLDLHCFYSPNKSQPQLSL